MKNSSAFYSPAASAIEMLESYFFNNRKILPCCAFLEGEYNINNLCVGVPVVIGKNGVEEIVILDLEESEKNELMQSSIAVEELVKKCKKLLV
jgi:malate dehydrogenase